MPCVPAGVGTLLLAFQTRLAKKAIVGPAKDTGRIVLLRWKRKTAHFNAPADLLLQAGGLKPVEGSVAGAGRVETRVYRHLRVTVRTRSDLDRADRDDVRLTEADTGHFAIEDAVFDALHLWVPEDAAGNWLLFEPMRLAGSTDAEQNGKEINWTESTLDFEFGHILVLTQTDPW